MSRVGVDAAPCGRSGRLTGLKAVPVGERRSVGSRLCAWALGMPRHFRVRMIPIPEESFGVSPAVRGCGWKPKHGATVLYLLARVRGTGFLQRSRVGTRTGISITAGQVRKGVRYMW